MAKSKNGGKQPSVDVKDLRARKNPKGGAFQAHISLKGKKQGQFKGEGITDGTSNTLTAVSTDLLLDKRKD